MSIDNIELTQSRLKEFLNYNPETGIFTWKSSKSQMIAGSLAGHMNSIGYWKIAIDRKVYFAHRLVFLYMIGKFPKIQTDHINGIKDDNRWINLRECTGSQNQSNSPMQKNNTSGYKGVSWCKDNKNWRAIIYLNSNKIHIGIFDHKKDAARAYNKKSLELHGEFAYLNEVE